MADSTVYAVMKVVIEIPVRASSPKETLEELERVSMKEADRVLREKLPDCFRIIGTPEFSHATVRKNK